MAQIHKVVYKPDTQSTDEYIVFVNQAEYKKWKDGGKLSCSSSSSIPLALIVDAFDIFHSGQGAQGHLGRISKQTLETVFGTKHEDEAVKVVLEKGTIQASEGVQKSGTSSKNDSHGSQFVDTRGGGLRG
ncbi:DUF1960-domain-containing protein [Sistotremastrum suecicum HHB10207 ss-3]|uniref:DUF1960-domain-containing protein n=1 Tax=Sistotremastrum suecicum HHB10207 ss-3 TaxID=1314776 RepID=A0A165YPI1_9AGAM|nr:DUF1960-domain-containing protein [Sistotremastrum suecicum HHB10207 ss-3]